MGKNSHCPIDHRCEVCRTQFHQGQPIVSADTEVGKRYICDKSECRERLTKDYHARLGVRMRFEPGMTKHPDSDLDITST